MSAGSLAQLSASTFNWLGQYASSSGNRAYDHTELAVFFSGNVQKTINSGHLEGWPG